MEKTLEECLDDLYLLGLVQGEHNINWADEYNLMEHSQNYYVKIKALAQEYGVECSDLNVWTVIFWMEWHLDCMKK